MSTARFVAFADGSSLKNPGGPGGTGFIVFDREAQSGFAHQPKTEVRGRHELGALRAVGDVLSRGIQTFIGVGIEQVGRGAALHDERELPREVARIVEPGVEAAHPEDRHEVRSIAGEQHAPMAIVVEREALRVVDRNP